MENQYVESRDGGFYLKTSRVPLDGIVIYYARGESPESIRAHFPTLSLEQVYGAITFYLAHRAEVDRTIEEENELFEKLKAENPVPDKLREKLEQARQHLATPPKR
jgi:uncharacterized protein (DUF433 family)